MSYETVETTGQTIDQERPQDKSSFARRSAFLGGSLALIGAIAAIAVPGLASRNSYERSNPISRSEAHKQILQNYCEQANTPPEHC